MAPSDNRDGGRRARAHGIKRLKIGYNRVYGYYIDVPKTFTGELPEDYVRKQTLVANERYFTAELKQLETELTTAQERVCQLEYKYFCDLRDSIADRVERIQATAEQIAVVDTLWLPSRGRRPLQLLPPGVRPLRHNRHQRRPPPGGRAAAEGHALRAQRRPPRPVGRARAHHNRPEHGRARAPTCARRR